MPNNGTLTIDSARIGNGDSMDNNYSFINKGTTSIIDSEVYSKVSNEGTINVEDSYLDINLTNAANAIFNMENGIYPGIVTNNGKVEFDGTSVVNAYRNVENNNELVLKNLTFKKNITHNSGTLTIDNSTAEGDLLFEQGDLTISATDVSKFNTTLHRGNILIQDCSSTSHRSNKFISAGIPLYPYDTGEQDLNLLIKGGSYVGDVGTGYVDFITGNLIDLKFENVTFDKTIFDISALNYT